MATTNPNDAPCTITPKYPSRFTSIEEAVPHLLAALDQQRELLAAMFEDMDRLYHVAWPLSPGETAPVASGRNSIDFPCFFDNKTEQTDAERLPGSFAVLARTIHEHLIMVDHHKQMLANILRGPGLERLLPVSIPNADYAGLLTSWAQYPYERP